MGVLLVNVVVLSFLSQVTFDVEQSDRGPAAANVTDADGQPFVRGTMMQREPSY